MDKRTDTPIRPSLPAPERGHPWPPGRLTEAETLAGQRRYLQGLRYRGPMPDHSGHADWLIEQFNHEC